MIFNSVLLGETKVDSKKFIRKRVKVIFQEENKKFIEKISNFMLIKKSKKHKII